MELIIFIYILYYIYNRIPIYYYKIIKCQTITKTISYDSKLFILYYQ